MRQTSATSQLILRPIQPGDLVSKFALGDKSKLPLKIFLQKDAWEFHLNNIAKTYVLVENQPVSPRIWGYFSLTCSEIMIGESYDLDDHARANRYKTFPAAKIARLAIDKALQGQGCGKQMVSWCVSLVKDKIMPVIGCRFLVVDAKPDVIAFYEKLSFRQLNTSQNKQGEHPLMFLDLHKI